MYCIRWLHNFASEHTWENRGTWIT